MIACAIVGVREIDLITASLPRSMRLAISTSPSRVSSGHRAHLAQVHADRVVGLVERAGRQIELELLRTLAGAVEQLVVAVRLLRVDDLDPRTAEGAEQVVELVRRRDVGGEQLVDLVVEQVALFLADGDELPHFIVFFFDRQRRVLQTLLHFVRGAPVPNRQCAAGHGPRLLGANGINLLLERQLPHPQLVDPLVAAGNALLEEPVHLALNVCPFPRQLQAPKLRRRNRRATSTGRIGLRGDLRHQPGFLCT